MDKPTRLTTEKKLDIIETAKQHPRYVNLKPDHPSRKMLDWYIAEIKAGRA